jgi:anaerobic magnesium-protoporphyrin IX monomethyl ester cyclase
MKNRSFGKVVLINTPCSELDDDRLEPPLGILYMATILKQNGIDCEICDLSGLPKEQWQEKITIGDVYGFSTYSVTYNRTLEIRQLAQNINPKALMVTGGPHASALAQECAKDFDLIIIGEAEVTFLEVVKAFLKKQKTKGIITGTPIADLNQLPFPDYDLIDLSSYSRLVEGLPSISLLSSRGCPYNCAFCNSRVFSRGELRFRSPENVAAEIKQLMTKYGTTNFRFSDDLFTFSSKRVEEMTKILTPLNIRYRVFARSNSMTPKACKLLYRSGCRHVAIGIESMSQKMLDLLKKKTTVETNINAIKNAKEVGLKVRIYLLIGFPGETERTVRESLKILMDCDFDEFVVYSFIPYPGTAVWQNPKLWGAEIDRDFSQYVQIGQNRRTCFALATKDFTPKDVENWRQMTINELEKKKGIAWAGNSQDNR